MPNISNSQHINIIGVGEVCIKRSKRCKRLSIYVNRRKSVKVIIPYRLKFSEGESFLLKKIEWVKKSLNKIDTYYQQIKPIDKNFKLKTRSKIITLAEGKKFGFLFSNKEEIEIYYPFGHDLGNERTRNILKKMITECLRCEAKEYLPKRVAELAKNFNFNINEVKIKNSVSRWGSCSNKNNINLSLYLILLPDFLSEYVIIHELAHTVHRNHGPLFWDYLEKLSGNVKSKAKLLKQYKLEYFF